MKVGKLVFFGALYFSLSHVMAATHDEAFKNGVPFKELSASINENSTAITMLQTDTAVLRVDLEQLVMEVNSLKSRVETNESLISDLRTDVNDQEVLIRANITRIAEIQLSLTVLESDVANNAAEISTLTTELDGLKNQIVIDMMAMSDQIVALSDALNVEAESLMLLKIQMKQNQNGISGQVATIQSELIRIEEAFNARLDTTLVEQATYNNSVNLLQTQLLILNAGLTMAWMDLGSLEDSYQEHVRQFEGIYGTYNHVHVESHEHVSYYVHTHMTGHLHYYVESYSCGSLWMDTCYRTSVYNHYHSSDEMHEEVEYHDHLSDHEHLVAISSETEAPVEQ